MVRLALTVAAIAALTIGCTADDQAAEDAAQESADRFDLICDVTITYPAFRETVQEQWRVTFDLGHRYWSKHFNQSSQSPQFLDGVTDDEIAVMTGEDRLTIDRRDGSLSGSVAGGLYLGECERQPFTPFDQIPTRRF